MANTPAPTEKRVMRFEFVKELYYSEESGFGLFLTHIVPEKPLPRWEFAQEGKVKGKLPRLLPGEILEAEVTPTPYYNKYLGENEVQFVVSGKHRTLFPTTPQGMVTLLSEGFARKVGPSVAQAVVDKYGTKALDIMKQIESGLVSHLTEVPRIDDDEEGNDTALAQAIEGLAKRKATKAIMKPLLDLPGVGPRIASYLLSGWIRNRARHEILLMLFDVGVSPVVARKLLKKYGTEAPQKVRENPFILLEVTDGVRFSVADALAERAGMDADAFPRIQAGLVWTLSAAWQSGHSCLPENLLMQKAYALLNASRPTDETVLQKTLSESVSKGHIALEVSQSGRSAAYLPWALEMERNVARELYRLNKGPGQVLDRKALGRILARWGRTGVNLDASQTEALETLLTSPVAVLTGGPGTGKTTLVRIVKDYCAATELDVVEAAPTGKAARHMSADAKTIHRLIGLGFGGANGAPTQEVEGDLLVVDEVSMLELGLASALFSSVQEGTRVLLVGDSDQLPSVGAGTVLADLIRSGILPVARLDTIHRQKEGGIVDNAAIIRNLPSDCPGRAIDRLQASPSLKGEVTLYTTSDLARHGLPKSDEGIRMAVERVLDELRRAGYDPMRDIQVLAPMHKGDAGVATLNDTLREQLNPAGRRLEFETKNAAGARQIWRLGDKIMNRVNDYGRDVFNGEQGLIARVDPDSKIVEVNYPDLGARHTYTRDDLDNLQSAYAMTIHKSQGSEYPCVVMVLPQAANIMMVRNLLYTGLTRARERCVILACPESLEKALRNTRASVRYGMLRERLVKEWEKHAAKNGREGQER